jgi:hypothetical protein
MDGLTATASIRLAEEAAWLARCVPDQPPPPKPRIPVRVVPCFFLSSLPLSSSPAFSSLATFPSLFPVSLAKLLSALPSVLSTFSPSFLARTDQIVALTGNARLEQRLATKTAGMDDHLTKPSKKVDLETMIQKWEARAKSQAEAEVIVTTPVDGSV